jgi:hypothetical protein
MPRTNVVRLVSLHGEVLVHSFGEHLAHHVVQRNVDVIARLSAQLRRADHRSHVASEMNKMEKEDGAIEKILICFAH